MVHGYHVYKLIWDAACDNDILPCKREVGNPHDPSTVAVKKGTVVVSHMPRKISTICSIFIRQGGTILCRVNGSRHYSSDLPQGGLEAENVCTSQCTWSITYINIALALNKLMYAQP